MAENFHELKIELHKSTLNSVKINTTFEKGSPWNNGVPKPDCKFRSKSHIPQNENGRIAEGKQ